MHAAVYEEHGPAREVLRLTRLDDPQPGPGEVRVRMRVSAVNPTDWKARSGARGDGMQFPYIVPNQDGAGEIDAVGAGVSDDRVGERVWVYFAAYERQHGTAAELVCLPERQAVALPEGASLDLGASMGIPALTAHRCLFASGPIDGTTVLVAGGAGAVGHFAIELAARAGARVIATVSSDEKARVAEAAGAGAVVNYREAGAGEAIRAAAADGVGRIIEVAPVANLALDLEVLAPAGEIVSYASDESALRAQVFPLMRGNVTLRFVLIYRVPQAAIERALSDISVALADGALSELPATRFPLEEIAAAHEAVEQGALGKVLVDVA